MEKRYLRKIRSKFSVLGESSGEICRSTEAGRIGSAIYAVAGDGGTSTFLSYGTVILCWV